jgi:hypothetical protein
LAVSALFGAGAAGPAVAADHGPGYWADGTFLGITYFPNGPGICLNNGAAVNSSVTDTRVVENRMAGFMVWYLWDRALTDADAAAALAMLLKNIADQMVDTGGVADDHIEWSDLTVRSQEIATDANYAWAVYNGWNAATPSTVQAPAVSVKTTVETGDVDMVSGEITFKQIGLKAGGGAGFLFPYSGGGASAYYQPLLEEIGSPTLTLSGPAVFKANGRTTYTPPAAPAGGLGDASRAAVAVPTGFGGSEKVVLTVAYEVPSARVEIALRESPAHQNYILRPLGEDVVKASTKGVVPVKAAEMTATSAMVPVEVKPGDSPSKLRDLITVAAKTGAWPKEMGTGEPVPIVFRFTLMRHPQPALSFGSKTGDQVASLTRVFTGPGSWTLTAADLPAGVWESIADGSETARQAYSVTTQALRADQPAATRPYLAADFTDGWGLAQETFTRVTPLIGLETKAEGSVHVGGLLSDEGTISGVPAGHGSFAGAGTRFAADATVLTMTLWEVDQAVVEALPRGTTAPPASAVKVKSYEVPLENGDFQVGRDVAAREAGMCYVWHATYPGDTWLAAYSSDFADPWERQCAPQPGKPWVASVVSEPVADAGALVRDRAEWGAAPAGSTVEFWARTAPVKDLFKPSSEWECDLAKATAPARVGDPVAVAGEAGAAWSNPVEAGPAGWCVLFQVVLKDKAGAVLAEGVWGDPAETVMVPPVPKIASQVAAPVADAGGLVRDKAIWEGAPFGAKVVFETRTAPVKDPRLPVDRWECDLNAMGAPAAAGSAQPVGSLDGETLSPEVEAPEVGTCLLWREVLLGPDGRETASGQWGEPSETTLVKAAPAVTTEVVELVVDAGAAAQDNGSWTGAPAGSTVEFQYRVAPVKDAKLPVDRWECDLDQMGDPAPAGGPWPTDAHEGSRLSDQIAVSEAGVCVLFRETLRGHDGAVLAEGEWGDEGETAYAKAPPAVATEVVELVIDAGSAAQDDGSWTGAPAGSTVEFQHRLAPVKDAKLPVDRWECDLDQMGDPAPAGGPWPTDAHEGSRLSDQIAAAEAGVCVLFKEILRDKDGTVLAEGEWGDPSETVYVKAPLAVATRVVELAVEEGSAAQDDGSWTGAPAGSTVEFEYRVAPVKDAAVPAAEQECDLGRMGDPAPAGGPWPTDGHEGSRLSDKVETEQAGVCVLFKLTLRDQGRQILAEGKWGDPSETVTVVPKPAAPPPGLPFTGSNPWPLAGGAAALLAAGAALVAGGRRRNRRISTEGGLL